MAERLLGDTPSSFTDAFIGTMNAETQAQIQARQQSAQLAEQILTQKMAEKAAMQRAAAEASSQMQRLNTEMDFKREMLGYQKIADEQKAAAKLKADEDKKVTSGNKNRSNLMSRLDRMIGAQLAQDVGGIDPITGVRIPGLGFDVPADTKQKLKAVRTVQAYDRYGLPKDARNAVATYFGLDPVKNAKKITSLYSGIQRLTPVDLDSLVHSGMELKGGQYVRTAMGKYKEPMLESPLPPIDIPEVDYSGYNADTSAGDGADDFFKE